MLVYPDIDPVALGLGTYEILGITIGPINIHWYGISYLVAFLGCWLLLRYRASKQAKPWKKQEVDDLIFYAALGVVLGGRMGYVLFYNFDGFLNNPLILLAVHNGGMSFHGGLIGVAVAMWLYARKIGRGYFEVSDFVAVVTPFGLASGRIGNFINAELWGRATDVPWAMVFPTDPLHLPRHPSMLYEFFLEGVLLFIILWFYSRTKRPTMAVTGLFLACYGLFRFAVEFVRQPDAHMGVGGFIAMQWLTMGMLLSLPMLLLGVFLVLQANRSKID